MWKVEVVPIWRIPHTNMKAIVVVVPIWYFAVLPQKLCVVVGSLDAMLACVGRRRQDFGAAQKLEIPF